MSDTPIHALQASERDLAAATTTIHTLESSYDLLMAQLAAAREEIAVHKTTIQSYAERIVDLSHERADEFHRADRAEAEMDGLLSRLKAAHQVAGEYCSRYVLIDAELAALRERHKRMVEALREARDNKEKWDLDGDLKRLDAILREESET